jgi:hypothetical protein
MPRPRLVLDHLGAIDKKKIRIVCCYELSRGDMTFTVPLLNYLMTAHQDLAAGLPDYPGNPDLPSHRLS